MQGSRRLVPALAPQRGDAQWSRSKTSGRYGPGGEQGGAVGVGEGVLRREVSKRLPVKAGAA